jgi:hypothetical protein
MTFGEKFAIQFLQHSASICADEYAQFVSSIHQIGAQCAKLNLPQKASNFENSQKFGKKLSEKVDEKSTPDW